MADVFISYSRADYGDFVKTFVDDLRAQNIDVWIDQHSLKPGTPDWEQAIRDAIRDSRAVLLIATADSRRSPYVRSELAISRMEEKPIYPIWAKGEDKRYLDCVPLGYDSVQAIDARGVNFGRALGEIVQVIRGEKSIATLTITAEFVPSQPIVYPPTITIHEPVRPYKGLESFKESDKGIFFGRENLSETLTTRVQAVSTGESRLLAVVGASGSGKSSVIMAGMIPRLREQTDWLILDPMTPGAKPLRTLALILASHLTRPLTSILEDLRHPMAEGLDLIAREIGEKKHIFLYIDQFEEIFTLISDENDRQQFINLLVTAATEPGGPLVVMLSLRADFYDRPSNYPELGGLINRHNELILPMSLSELVDAVERPAVLANLRFEPGLVSEIVFALREKSGAMAGALPLLQFALERLYDERDGDKLTRAAYEKIGGIEGAIGNHAEEVFKTLDEPAQNALGQVFRNLVNPGEPPTRKRAKLADATGDNGSKALVDTLVNARLLITGREEDETFYLEVAHEALLRTWTRLATWIASIADDLRLLDEVKEAAQKWDATGRPEYLWWKHEQLAPVYDMIERFKPSLDEGIQAFLEPEADRLLREFNNPVLASHRQLTIIDRWAVIGETAAPSMAEALKSTSVSKQIEALGVAFCRFPSVALPLVVSLLGDDILRARRNAANILGLIGDPQAIPALVNALRDTDEYVRRNATDALGQIGNNQAIPALLDLLRDQDRDLHERAVRVLGKIMDVAAVPALINALGDSDYNVRHFAAGALGDVGDSQAVPALLKTLHDNNSRVRGRAASVLGEIGDAHAVTGLLDALRDEDLRVRGYAANALGEIGHTQAVDGLLDSLKDLEASVRQFAALALGKISDSRAVSGLAHLLSDKIKSRSFTDARICDTAASALEHIGTSEALAALDHWKAEHPDDYAKWQNLKQQQAKD